MSASREPVFKAPWPAMALTLAILAAFAFQRWLAPPQLLEAFAYRQGDLATGRWVNLFAALFLHQGWAHVLMNAAGALAFGAPVSRMLGTGGRGAIAYFLLFLLCGALANFGFGELHEQALLIGASGGVSALFGGAARCMAGQGVRPGPLLTRPVIAMSAAWIGINVLVGVVGFAPGAGDALVAWEAHVMGFLAGLFLIDLFFWAAQGGKAR